MTDVQQIPVAESPSTEVLPNITEILAMGFSEIAEDEPEFI